MIPDPCEAQPEPKKNQVKITNENTNKKHEDHKRWHGQSRERNQVQGMSVSKVVTNKVKYR